MNRLTDQKNDSYFRSSLMRSRTAQAFEPKPRNNIREFNPEMSPFTKSMESIAPFTDGDSTYGTLRPYRNKAQPSWNSKYYQ